jgi:metallo-beta-lactamase class B
VLIQSCGGRDAKDEPAPPVHIHGDIFYVGTCGTAALLIVSPAGHVLIDVGSEMSAKFVAANIERLGYRLRDVRYILNSHEHYDHTGGIKELKRLTGATIVALSASRPVLEAGHSFRDDPQLELLKPFPAFHVDRVIRDGETVTLGTLRLTAHSTPAHSRGSTSWTWQSCEQGNCIRVAYADSLTTPVDKDYRFLDHPAHVAEYRAALDKIAALPCDLLITPHPSVSNFFNRLSGRAALIDGAACAAYAKSGAAILDAQLRSERAAAGK